MSPRPCQARICHSSFVSELWLCSKMLGYLIGDSVMQDRQHVSIGCVTCGHTKQGCGLPWQKHEDMHLIPTMTTPQRDRRQLPSSDDTGICKLAVIGYQKASRHTVGRARHQRHGIAVRRWCSSPCLVPSFSCRAPRNPTAWSRLKAVKTQVSWEANMRAILCFWGPFSSLQMPLSLACELSSKFQDFSPCHRSHRRRHIIHLDFESQLLGHDSVTGKPLNPFAILEETSRFIQDHLLLVATT